MGGLRAYGAQTENTSLLHCYVPQMKNNFFYLYIYIYIYICIYKTLSLSVCLSAIEIKLETFRYKQTYESYITFSREAKYDILILIRIIYGGATSLWGSTRGLFVLLYNEIKIMKTH